MVTLTVLKHALIYINFPCLFKHEWEEATCTTPKKCSVCNREEGNPISPTGEHEWKDITCTQSQPCIYCGKIKPALGHDFVGATCIVAGKCSRCNEKGTIGHNYKDGICTMCGKEQEIIKNDIPQRIYKTLSTKDDDFHLAVAAAQSLVKEKLITPSSAKFPLTDYEVKCSDRDFIVVGYVDSQNVYGAMIRKNFGAFFTMGKVVDGKYSISDGYVLFE